jgi:predicted nucleic acid-binding protein
MAKIKLLIDTDIFIDALKSIKSARDLFKLKELELHCSVLTKNVFTRTNGQSPT